MTTREKLEKNLNERLYDLKYETMDRLELLEYDINEEETKKNAFKNLCSDSIDENVDDKIKNIALLASVVPNSKVAFFIFFDMFLPSERKIYLPVFNSIFKTKYTTLRKFLLDSGFSNTEEWESYVKDYALDYQNGVILKREQLNK